MSTTTEPTTLGRWPAPCNQDGCLAHLARKTDRCRCPRYKASAAGYHITSRNLNCPVHGPADVAANGQAASSSSAYSDDEVNAAQLGHAPTCEFRIWGRGSVCTCQAEPGPVLVADTDSSLEAWQRTVARFALADVDDVCHREIEGTDDILSPCPQCGHLIAVHVGTDGCPVCVVEMLAAAHRAAAKATR